VSSFSSRWSFHRSIAAIAALAAALTITTHDASAEPPEEIGPEFRVFHSEAGGIHVFGYALSPRVIENGRVAQYFERQRFESHSENNPPYDVLLGRLGAKEAARRGLTETEAFRPLAPGKDPDPNCLFFEQTGHQVCTGFKLHWKKHGLNLGDNGVSPRESIALFGYPISREFTDPDTGLTTQYFERARFEYHEEHKGTPYEVLLGRIGSPMWHARRQYARFAPAAEPDSISTVSTGTFIWPTEGVITQGFGHTSFSQSASWYGGSGHTGIDIANTTNTPIHAADGGTVIKSGWMAGYGFTVVIDHGNGYESWYAHMAQQPPVSVGQTVSQGEYIGPMGATGYATGPHLHFEIRKGGYYLNPLQYLN
jgi:hypothetical protein